MLVLEDEFPNLDVNTTKGHLKIFDFIGNSWCILYCHTLAFTPICLSDLAAVVKVWPEYEKRNLKAMALTCSPVDQNQEWSKDILTVSGTNLNELPFPIISDVDRTIAVKLGMIHQKDKDKHDFPMTVKKAILISPDKKVKSMLWYPDQVGRNYLEILRMFDATLVSSHHKYKVGTPANWNRGEKCFILPTTKPDEITQMFPKGYEVVNVPSKKQYLKLTDCSQ